MKILNKKNISKIIVCLLIALLAVNIAYAGSVSQFNGDLSAGGAGATVGKEAITLAIASVLNIVRIAGSAIALIMLMTVAVKYILASAGDKADIKKYALNYVIGALVLFSASAIVSLVRDSITNSIGSTGSGN